jgi:putative hydrolase of the HAD superfamily
VLRAVLLDVDDTLVDTRAAFAAAIRQVVATWMPHLDDAQCEAALRHWVRDPSGHFRAYTRGEIDFETQRRRRAADLHAAFGGPVLDEATADTWDAGYEAAFRAAWRVRDDAAPLLDAVCAAGLRVAAVTNMLVEYQRAKLAAVGLLGRLPIIVGIDTAGAGKPDPRIFLRACELLEVAPAEAAYVGDELDVDARGARDAGLVGVWLDRHGSGEEPSDVPVVRSLAELPQVLGITSDGTATRT